METTLLILLSILPAVLLLLYFEKKDNVRKEPLALKWKIFWWGIVAAFVARGLEMQIDPLFNGVGNFWVHIALGSFITAALVEESIKLWVVKTYIYGHKHFNEVMDGITYCIIASLGFATIENIMYVVEGGLTTAIMRALLSVPAHALFSGIMGYYIGKSRFIKSNTKKTLKILKGLIIGIFYHGLFNFILFSQTNYTFLVVPLVTIMGIHLHAKIKKAHEMDKKRSGYEK